MKRRWLIYFLIISSGAPVYSQKPDKSGFTRDSLEIMRVKLIRPQFKFDNRLTWHEGQAMVINGFDAGALLKDKMRLTLGYYRLNENVEAFKKVTDSLDTGALVKINYGSVNMEFIYKNTRFFSLGMPLEIGIGKNELSYKNFTEDRVYEKNSSFIVVTYFGLSATFKPIRWIGLKGIAGYRKTAVNMVKEFNFDGLFTSLGLNIDIQEIIKDIRMFRLKKRYKRGDNIGNAVDLITD